MSRACTGNKCILLPVKQAHIMPRPAVTLQYSSPKQILAVTLCLLAGCACTQNFDPVCGRDGQTYSNSGCAACANMEVVSKGACGKMSAITSTFLFAMMGCDRVSLPTPAVTYNPDTHTSACYDRVCQSFDVLHSSSSHVFAMMQGID